MNPIHEPLAHTEYDPWSDDRPWTKRRSTKCWKDREKRKRQYKRIAHIIIDPGFVYLCENKPPLIIPRRQYTYYE